MKPVFLAAALLVLPSFAAAFVDSSSMNFSETKRFLKDKVIQDGDLDYYCGCPIVKTGKKLVVDLQACGYEVRKNAGRASRIEFEHVIPASFFGQQLKCWQEGGRKNCTENDPQFSAMEGDPHNLLPVVGEVNGDRGSLKYGMIASTDGVGYGQCGSRVDFKSNVFMPRKDALGDIARINFYFNARYGMQISKQQQQLFQSWSRLDPVDRRECTRDSLIAAKTGVSNSFVQSACSRLTATPPSGGGVSRYRKAVSDSR